MDYQDDEPELAGYVPSSTGRPLRSPHLVRMMRLVVVLGIACLILPGVITGFSVAANTAHDACAAWVRYEAPGARGSSAQFELFGSGGMGWQCYTVGAFGGDRRVASLGLIPISPRLSPVPLPATNS